MSTHVPLSPSSTIWYQSQGRDVLSWEGNHRSGMQQTIQWCNHLQSQGLIRGDEDPNSTPHRAQYSFFTFYYGNVHS